MPADDVAVIVVNTFYRRLNRKLRMSHVAG